MRKTFTFEGHRYEVTAPNEIELGKKIERKLKELKDGTKTINSDTTVKRWSQEWLETYRKGSISDESFDYVKNIVDNHIVPEIGRMRVKDVKPTHLQKILNSKTEYSKSFVGKIRIAMKQMFFWAMQNRLILDNPAEHLKLPKVEDGTHRAITENERKHIMKLAETHKSGLWVMIMLLCGLRPGETRLIQGKHIDLKNMELNVPGTKTKAAKRTLPIPPELATMLEQLRLKPFDYLFTQETTGKQHTKQSMRGLWSSFCRDLNIQMGTKVKRNQLIPPFALADDLTPYCLRHTFCTDLQAAGVPINVAKELMGHEDISTTSRIYTHRSEEAFKNAAELMKNYNAKKYGVGPTVGVEKTSG